MARTDADLVKEVLGKDYDTNRNPPLTFAIRSAYATISRVVACASTKGNPLSDEEAVIIETYLAAHNYCISDKAYSSKSTGGASASYQGQTGMGLEATLYGQQAMLNDPSGCLENLAKTQVASGFYLSDTPDGPP